MSQTLTTSEELDRKLAKAMTEAELQREVNKRLRANGWRFAHFRTAITSKGAYVTAMNGNKGFPDVIAIRGHRLLFAELKKQGKNLEPEQAEWRDALEGCQVAVLRDDGSGLMGRLPEIYSWKPADLINGEITRVLL